MSRVICPNCRSSRNVVTWPAIPGLFGCSNPACLWRWRPPDAGPSKEYLRPARDDSDRVQRGVLLANMRHLRGDIETIFVDAEHWNRLHPDELPIDPDPDGELRRLADQLDAKILCQSEAKPS